MVITREMIEKRLAQLRAELAQAQANVSAYNGAIEDCVFWLAFEGAADPKSTPEQPADKK